MAILIVNTIKNNKINSNKNILISCTFLKIITRCIKLAYNINYCDECRFSNKNNNLYIWKKSKEELYFTLEYIQRFTLIMAVNDNNINHF